MLYLIIIILVIIILFLIWKGFLGGRAEEAVKGICAAAMGQSKEKMENKQRILEFLSKNGKATNVELRELVNVSKKTIVNYTDELEREGKIEQVGETGRFACYKLK